MEDNSNKTIVVYKSKYGSAKTYAEWITEEVKADLLDSSKISIEELIKYDTIVYVGAMYAVGILGISLIKNNYDKLRDKKVIVVSVGASPAHSEAVKDIKDGNFTEEMKEKVHFFHVRGSFDYSKLNITDKFLMFMLKKKIELKKEEKRDNDEIGMLASYKRPTDWKNRKSIIPIIECIKG